MGCDTTYNASWVFCTIWIAPKCHQTTHLWFCGAATELPRNDRKSCSYSPSKSWNSLIYHPMSPRGIPRHSVHGSWGRLMAWLKPSILIVFRAPPGSVIFFTENLPMGCVMTYNASLVFRTIWIAQNATNRPIYYFLVQPRNDSKTVVKAIVMLVQSRGSPKYTIPCLVEASHDIRCTGPVDV